VGDADIFKGGHWSVYTASALWLLSLGLTFFVQFPRDYQYNKQSSESIKAMHQRIVKHKKYLLYTAMLAFGAALFLLMLVALEVLATK